MADDNILTGAIVGRIGDVGTIEITPDLSKMLTGGIMTSVLLVPASQ